MKTAFCSDLDNTLIYSHRKIINQDKVTAELLNGREQSYMTKFTYDLIRDNSRIDLIPVTMRTKEQYERIFVLNDICSIAVVCGGGSLIINGAVDEDWEADTMKIAGSENDAISDALKLITRIKNKDEIQNVAPYMFYFKSNSTALDADFIRKNSDTEKIKISYDDRKVYCIAKSINKGQAVIRLREKYNFEHIIAAGDSEFDIPMLEEASAALVNEKIFNNVKNERKHILKGEMISNQVCMLIKQLI